MIRSNPFVREEPTRRLPHGRRRSLKDCECRSPRVRETVEPDRPDDIEPVILEGSPGTKCRPFLTVQKDSERFAACNALADEIGPIDDAKKAFRLLEDAIGDEVNEVFGVLTLDLHKRMKGLELTGRGEETSVMAPIASTCRAAVLHGAYMAIIFHVHPSGIEAQPSEADDQTTEAFVEAFNAINIPLLDHVIVAGDTKNRSYYSYAENDQL